MTTEQKNDLVSGVAFKLGGVVDSYDNLISLVRMPDGGSVALDFADHKNKICIRCFVSDALREFIGYCRKRNDSEIRVSNAKTYDQIAWEINSRLMPCYIAFRDECQSFKDKHDKYVSDAMERYKKLGGYFNVDTGETGGDPPKSLQLFSSDLAHVDAECRCEYKITIKTEDDNIAVQVAGFLEHLLRKD